MFIAPKSKDTEGQQFWLVATNPSTNSTDVAIALGSVLVAGVVFLIISLTPIRAWLINSIPKSLKLGIGAGIGLFLGVIGFEIMGLTADHPVTLVTLGNLSNPLTLLGAGAFISMIVMEKMKILILRYQKQGLFLTLILKLNLIMN